MNRQEGPARRNLGLTTPGATSPRTSSTPSDEDVEDLALRLCRALAGTREEGRFTIEQFLDAAERGFGGELVWRAPHRQSKRSIFEAGYRSERYDEATGKASA